MKSKISKYIESKQLAWAPSTLRSEEARLMALVDVLDGNPATLWEHMEKKNMAPYARLTTWIRVVNFWEHSHSRSENPYRAFKAKNARLFKNTYTPKRPEMTYEEAKRRIETIQDETVRRRALEIIGSGTRWTESGSHSGGVVSGKGSKDRAVYVPEIEGSDYKGSYQTFRRALAKVGLKPHDLRKLFLTKLVDMGANEFELMEAAGWSSLGPARSYINPNKAALIARIRKMQKGEK